MNEKFPVGSTPIKLYRHPLSGHCHRAELMLALLDLPYEPVDIDLLSGEHKEDKFLALNLFGEVPVIDDNGTIVADSTAILVYLNAKYNDGYEWMPQDPTEAAVVQRWFSVAAGLLASGPCSVRLVHVFGVELDYDLAKQKTETLFGTIEPLLAKQSFLAGDNVTLADIAMYTYTSHAPEGGVSLEPYPAISAWLERIEALPKFVGMGRSPLPEA